MTDPQGAPRDPSMSLVHRLGLVALGLNGAVMIGQWWGHSDSPRTAAFTIVLGVSLLLMALRGLTLPRSS
ncbi:MAG: hypothetical protein P8R54_01715 [Myxococcota bacterium]|nr:hypothetical protein [Myxococcota bacterium]